MSKRRNLTGLEIGQLKVLCYVYTDKRKQSHWLCKCTCGKYKIIRGDNLLKTKPTKSCGCLKTGPPHKDLTGLKICKLTVIRPAGKNTRGEWYHLCKCLCGKFKKIQTRNLTKNNPTESCGCLTKEHAARLGTSKISNLIGNVYNRLTVLSFAHTKNNRSYWNCLCECGNKSVVACSQLINEKTKSCGCLSRELAKDRMTGSNHYNWKGGVAPLHDKLRVLPEYSQWRTNVYIRDDYTCQMCGKRGGKTHGDIELNSHHIYMLSKYSMLAYSPWNGITLCEPCHKSIRNKEEKYIQQFLDITMGKT